MSVPANIILFLLVGAGALAAQSPDCTSEALRNVSTTRNDDSFTRVKWESRNCKGSVEITGRARVAGDLSGFASIADGGRVVIETEGKDAERKLTLTPSNSRFAYQYEVNGKRQAWDGEGERWLSGVVTMLVRRAGYGAEERVDYLLREQGVAGVLDEVRALGSDHMQRKYLDLLLGRTTLNAGALRSIIELAGRELQSDHELAQLLLAVSTRYTLTHESRVAYVAATASLDSDHERGRVLRAVLSKGALSADDVVAVLNSAAEMGSDHERAQVLKQVSRDGDFGNGNVQRAYLEAAAGMNSDYERRQVLTALLSRGKLTPAATDVVLTAAASFSSDHERAEVLTLLLNTQTLTQAQKGRMVKLIDEIRSDHERGKVASLMLKQINVN